MIQQDPFQQRLIVRPKRLRGLIVHGIAACIFGGIVGILTWLGLQSQTDVNIVMLIVAFLLFLPLMAILYRWLTILRANYWLDRDGLRLRWGLRSVDIPLGDIEWLRQAEDLVIHLPLPLLSFTGFIRGTRLVEGLGKVEYLATDLKSLLLVATPGVVYVISPAQIPMFMRQFQDALEMGSLSPVAAYSVEPSSFLSRLWHDRIIRSLVSLGLLFNGMLLGMVSLVVPTRQMVSIGFYANGMPSEPVQAFYLFILPVIGFATYGVDVILGAFFYRRDDQRSIAYLVWGSSLLTPLLLAGSLIFIV